jgi:hypothetical protein
MLPASSPIFDPCRRIQKATQSLETQMPAANCFLRLLGVANATCSVAGVDV